MNKRLKGAYISSVAQTEDHALNKIGRDHAGSHGKIEQVIGEHLKTTFHNDSLPDAEQGPEETTLSGSFDHHDKASFSHAGESDASRALDYEADRELSSSSARQAVDSGPVDGAARSLANPPGPAVPGPAVTEPVANADETPIEEGISARTAQPISTVEAPGPPARGGCDMPADEMGCGPQATSAADAPVPSAGSGGSFMADAMGWGADAFAAAGGYEAVLSGELPFDAFNGDGSDIFVFIENLDLNIMNNTMVQETNVSLIADNGGILDIVGDVVIDATQSNLSLDDPGAGEELDEPSANDVSPAIDVPDAIV